ncbi:hypothetical protein ALC56_11887, partial [Trachymyrmex septentrionalis]
FSTSWVHFLHELIDEVSNGSPRGVFCATPFSGSATRCPTEICTKEETTRAGGPICKARSVFWPPRILMYSQNTCNVVDFFINRVLGLTVWSQREINTITHGISRNPPHANAGDPSEIIREGAGSDARSIDLKVRRQSSLQREDGTEVSKGTRERERERQRRRWTSEILDIKRGGGGGSLHAVKRPPMTQSPAAASGDI